MHGPATVNEEFFSMAKPPTGMHSAHWTSNTGKGEKSDDS